MIPLNLLLIYLQSIISEFEKHISHIYPAELQLKQRQFMSLRICNKKNPKTVSSDDLVYKLRRVRGSNYYAFEMDSMTQGSSRRQWVLNFAHLQPCKRKRRDLTQSYDKSPYTDRKSKKQRDNTKTPPETSITQRLQTDLGRSVWVTVATQLVQLNRFTGYQPSH